MLANNINTELALERPEWEPVFADNEKREVGGEVTGVEELTEDGIYVVKRDINVRPGRVIFGDLISEKILKYLLKNFRGTP